MAVNHVRTEPAATAGRAVRSGRWLLLVGAVGFAAAVTGYALAAHAFQPQMWYLEDLDVYRWGGKMIWAGHHQLYTGRWHGFLPFSYPPIAGALFVLTVPFRFATLKWAMTAFSIAALTATIWWAWGMLGYRRSMLRAGAALAVAAVALWTEPVQQTLIFGQVNLLLLALIVGDLAQRDERWWKGIGVGLAAGVKLTPVIFVAYLLCTRRFRAAGVATATLAVTVLAGFVFLPQESHQYWIGRLFLDTRRVGNDFVSNQSIHGLAVRLAGGSYAAPPAALALTALLGIAGLAAAVWAYRRGRELLGVTATGLTALLVSPISWSHHWVWIVPVLVIATDLAWRRRSYLIGAATTGLVLLFAAWPVRVAPGQPRWPQGLLWTVPFGNGLEHHWHGTQLLIGNLYIVVGLVLLALIPLVTRQVAARGTTA